MSNRTRGMQAGLWLAIGAGVGTAFGVAAGDVALWLSFGAGVGLAAGAIIDTLNR